MYHGFSIVAIMTLPSHGIYFGMYETTKTFFGKILEADQPPQPAQRRWSHDAIIVTSGMAAEFGSAPIWTIQEMIKQRIQAQVYRKPADESGGPIRQVLNGAMATDGVRGLFRGFGTGLLVYVPFASIYFWVFERSHQVYDAPMTCGLLAGAAATITTHPLDVIRTHVVVSEQKQSALCIARNLYRREGARGLTRGLLSRTLWLSPSAALTIGTYQYLLDWFCTL